MRLRTWELPMNVVGELTETPFVIIVDRVTDSQVSHLATEFIKESTGARSVLIFADSMGDVELGESA